MKIKPEDYIDKPQALMRYEQTKEMNVPYKAGGLVDQPYLWMEQHGVIMNTVFEWKAIQRALAQESKAQE